MSPCLNSDGASKSCVNWGSRGDGAECASPLGFCVLCRTPSRGLRAAERLRFCAADRPGTRLWRLWDPVPSRHSAQLASSVSQSVISRSHPALTPPPACVFVALAYP